MLDDWGCMDAFKMFIMYIYLSRYEVSAGMCLPDACILHAQVYVLAERLAMDDLKRLAFEKLSSILGQDSWSRFAIQIGSEDIMVLLKIVYDGTRDDGNEIEDREYQRLDVLKVDTSSAQGEDDLRSNEGFERTAQHDSEFMFETARSDGLLETGPAREEQGTCSPSVLLVVY